MIAVAGVDMADLGRAGQHVCSVPSDHCTASANPIHKLVRFLRLLRESAIAAPTNNKRAKSFKSIFFAYRAGSGISISLPAYVSLQ